MSLTDTTATFTRIEIPGDVLVPDEEFCQLVLGGATRRTASRLEAQGLPFTLVAAGAVRRAEPFRHDARR